MYHERIPPPTVETCRYRQEVCGEGTGQTASCGLLKSLLGENRSAWCSVGRDACDACCRSFPPSPTSLNPVIASLVYQRASRIADAEPAADDQGRLDGLLAAARDALDVVYLEALPAASSGPGPTRSLSQALPPPAHRCGPGVRNWAVGVTTSPRRQETVAECIESLLRAGWEQPNLFIDGAVRIPERFSHLPGTLRDRKIGAWPSYYLALAELLMRRPDADAYLIAQDDAVFYDRESLPAYLGKILWPGKTLGLVSLYSPSAPPGARPGWNVCSGSSAMGPVAMVFPRELAKALVSDRTVLEHRWARDPAWATSLDDVISDWAGRHGLFLWFPSPSLAQHVGDTSTLWPQGRALGHRRAEWFAGEVGYRS